MLEVVKGIKAQLVSEAVAGAARTYFQLAESDAKVFPYIIIDFIGGGDENYIAGDMRDEIWQVGVVSGGLDASSAFDTARTGQAAIRAALHGQTFAVDSWRVEICWHTTPFFVTEIVAGQKEYYAGGRYRLRLFAS